MDYFDGQSGGRSQLSRDGFGNDDRTMAASRAANRDRKITLSLALISREDIFEKGTRLGEEILGLGSGHDVPDYGFVKTRESAELRHEKWVIEESHVEDDVRVDRHSILESKRDDSRRHATRTSRSRAKMGHENSPEIVDAGVRRVDHAGSASPERSEPLALDSDSVEHGESPFSTALGRERVWSSAFAEAP
jgi:hypothetical protein